MDARTRVRHQEEQRAVALGVALQRHRVAAQANILAVHGRHGLGRVHHRRQALALLQAALVGKGAHGFRRVVVDIGHLLERLLVRLGHQLQPVGFRQFGMGQGAGQQQWGEEKGTHENARQLE
ncbi:hypothetical protein D3C85_1399720 [compost metagenome]